ncbi:transposase [Microcoleus sp. herbarium14]|uniref:transposase n=1 Tax=Microcoleus sp. herbarium14 TaxID=3055439 RepID=UPI002FD64166
MKATPTTLQDRVSYDTQIADLRNQFEQIPDLRASNCSYTLPDLLMSVFAMFSLKYESLLDFEKQTQSAKANLKNLFGVKKFSSDSCLRKVLDKLDWTTLRGIFVKQFDRLNEIGIVKEYNCLGNYTLVSVDAVEHFNSKKIHCDCCLTKTHKEGEITYTHSMLCAVMVHPDQSEVFIIGTEPIQQQDGIKKNDCERNASKRLLDWLSVTYSGIKLLFVEDALYSTAPNIKQIRSNNWDFILAVKPDGNKHLFRTFHFRKIANKFIDLYTCKDGKNSYDFWFFNNVSLNESNSDVKVNFVYCQQTNSTGKITNFSWVTSIEITVKNVFSLMKAGRARWKIENEVFNTLKNQGYRFEHNYGHGQENLSCVFAHLMLLAFLSDQIIERCNKTFQMVHHVVITKTKLWFCVKAAFLFKEYKTFKDIYVDIGNHFQLQLE